MGDRPMWSQEIFRRAHKRGEIDQDTNPAAVLTMPFDLIRHDLLMTLKPLPADRIRRSWTTCSCRWSRPTAGQALPVSPS